MKMWVVGAHTCPTCGSIDVEAEYTLLEKPEIMVKNGKLLLVVAKARCRCRNCRHEFEDLLTVQLEVYRERE